MVLLNLTLVILVAFALKKIYGQSFNLECHFIRDRAIRTLKIAGLFLVYIWLLEDMHMEIGLLYAVLPGLALITYLYTFYVRESPTSKLAIVPSILNRGSVSVHLASPMQPFDKATYIELKQVIRKLKSMNVEKVTLCSPMFYKADKLRNTTRLQQYLSSDVTRIECREIAPISDPLGLFTLFFYKHIRRSIPLKKLNILKWHEFELYLI